MCFFTKVNVVKKHRKHLNGKVHFLGFKFGRKLNYTLFKEMTFTSAQNAQHVDLTFQDATVQYILVIAFHEMGILIKTLKYQ